MVEQTVSAELGDRFFNREVGHGGGEDVEAVSVVGVSGGCGMPVAGVFAGSGPKTLTASEGGVECPAVGGEDVCPVGLCFVVVSGLQTALSRVFSGGAGVGAGGLAKEAYGGFWGFVEGVGDCLVERGALSFGDGGGGCGAAGEHLPGVAGLVVAAGGGCSDEVTAFAAGFGQDFALCAACEFGVAGHLGACLEAVDPVEAAGG